MLILKYRNDILNILPKYFIKHDPKIRYPYLIESTMPMLIIILYLINLCLYIKMFNIFKAIWRKLFNTFIVQWQVLLKS